MFVLFDYSVPSPLRRAGFEVLLTADKNIRYQQNLAGRRIAIVELSTPQWPVVRLHVDRIVSALDLATAGSYAQVHLAPDRRR